MSTATDIETFVCDDCGKEFGNANSLAGHQRNPGKAHEVPVVSEPATAMTLEEAKAQAAADRAARASAFKAGQSEDLSASRTRGTRKGTRFGAAPSLVPWPELDFDFVAPTAYFAVVDALAEFTDDVEFHLDAEKLRGLPFTKPGGSIPNKPLYTIKAVHQDGRLVQLPFEDQINNQIAADTLDAVGLRKYLRKGVKILINWDTLVPVYCAAWDCWAPAITPENAGEYPAFRNAANTGFCSIAHASKTLPNMYDDEGGIRQGLMANGVTTSRIWSAGSGS